ncbi:MAG TPA: hypothetical protein VK184_09960 [Nostocaceae cyanobacterium]|nr:hypothetical protein [Nostocaceae cyanobacterium]
MSQYIISPSASRDLDEIANYFRFYRSPYGISSNKSSKNLALSRLQVLIP